MTEVVTINEVIQLVKVTDKKVNVVTVGTQGPPGTGGGGSSDHGTLTGLSDDDHSQYHNDVRGDARYYTKSQMDNALSLIPKTAQVTVDFGNTSGGEADMATVNVDAEWVTNNSVILCNIAGVATLDHDAEDAALEGITAVATNLNEGIGFDVIARAPLGSWGRFNINIIGT